MTEKGSSHPLHTGFTLTFTHLPQGKAELTAGYTENIKTIASFSTVEDFWAVYSHCKRPEDLPPITEYHLFRENVKPMWEDEANANGGRWILSLKKGLSSRMWENLCLAVIGEQFGGGKEICGIVIRVRPDEDRIAVWNRSSTDRAAVNNIRDVMKRVLNLPPNTDLVYKSHKNLHENNAPFRNNDVR